jgi:hypothetical protein
MEIFAVALAAFLLAMAGMGLGFLSRRRGLGPGCAGSPDGTPVCRGCSQPALPGMCRGPAKTDEPKGTET